MQVLGIQGIFVKLLGLDLREAHPNKRESNMPILDASCGVDVKRAERGGVD